MEAKVEQSNLDGRNSRSKSSHQWLVLLAIVLAGLGLRLYHIDNHGLFVDEIYSVLVANGKGDPELIQFDAARPVYFLLLKAWLTLGSNERWMRLLSVLSGTLNIVLIYLLGREAGGRRVGYAAAVLTALSPMEIHYSQQVRMYTLGSFFALSGSLALFKALETSKKIYLYVWTAARALMVLTLPLTGMLLLGDGIYAACQRKESKLLPLMAVCATMLLLAWSPFICILLQAQASQYDSWRATLDAPNELDFLTLLVNFTASAIPLQECGGLPIYDWFTGAYVCLFPLVLALAVVECYKRGKIFWCAAWGLIPLTTLFIWSNIAPPLFITRYSMFTAPYVLILLSFGWAEMWRRWRPVGFGVAAVYLLAMTSYIPYFYGHAVHEDWRPVAQFIADHEKQGDKIVVWNYHSKYLLGYYYHGPNQISDMQVRLDTTPDNSGEDDIETLSVQLQDNPQAGQRLWFVSREAAPGWTRMHESYLKYKVELGKRFNIVKHTHLNMTDIYEAIVR